MNEIIKIQSNIITQLGINYENSNKKIIENLIEDYLQIASNVSHRKLDDEKLIPYVKKAVISAFNRLGSEGMTSSGEGSQNYQFLDIETKLKKDVMSIRVLV